MARQPPAVARVLERVTKTVRQHEMFRESDTVLVMVSGGPDSVCLLYSLWHLRRLFKVQLEVFHFDHHLRPDSRKDAVYVRRLAERLHVPFHLDEAEDRPRKGMSVEAWATVTRSNAANDVRRRIGAATMAEGHTLDDQAETVLLNLIRGTGLDGIVGIDAGDRGNRWVQPLIDVERNDVEAFCRALHLRPRRDPMNEDRRLLRNAIRLDVIPMLERVTDRAVKPSIARTAATLRGDRDELFSATHLAALDVIAGERGGEVTFDAAGLRALSPPMANRVVRLGVYNALSIHEPPWSKAAIEAVLDLARGRPGRTRNLPNGRTVRRDRTHVVVTRPEPSD